MKAQCEVPGFSFLFFSILKHGLERSPAESDRLIWFLISYHVKPVEHWKTQQKISLAYFPKNSYAAVMEMLRKS